MWTCSTHGTAAPIMKNAAGRETTPRRKTGTASKKPTKNTSAGASTYDGLMTCVENSRVHGNVISQPHTSQLGIDGSRSCEIPRETRKRRHRDEIENNERRFGHRHNL